MNSSKTLLQLVSNAFLRSNPFIPTTIVAILNVVLAPLVFNLGAAENNETTHLELTAKYAQSAKTMIAGRPFELAGILEITGADKDDIVAWVRDNIAFERYNGIRKGAVGTLVSGSGNSADQALLIASLFEYVGFSSELVRGQISTAELPKANAMIIADELADLPSAELMEDLAKKMGANVEDLYNQMEGSLHTRQAFLEGLWVRTLHDLDFLSAVMDEAGISAPQYLAADPKEISHWWVRTQDRDYDSVLAEPLEEYSDAYALNQLPETLFQKVTVRMFIQRSEIEGEEETRMEPVSVMDITLNSAEVFGFPLAIGNIPLDIESQLNSLKHPTPKDVVDVFASASQFQPQLQSPRGLLTGRPFNKTGALLQIKDGRIEATQKIGGSTGSLFGGAFGGVSEEETTSKLIGNWIEIELTDAVGQGDSEEPILIRRDLLKNPDGEKFALELLTARELLVHADELNSSWMAAQTLDYIADAAKFTQSMFNGTDMESMSAAAFAELTNQGPWLNSELFSFGLIRRNELIRLRNRIAPTACFTKQHPMVVSYVRGFISEENKVKGRNGLDILHQAFEVKNHQPEKWSESITFAAGILDTALELAIVQQSHPTESIRNSSVALSSALDTGAKTEVVELNGSIQFQIYDSSNETVIAHYQVDPRSGMSLGMMDDGGQAMTEYASYTNIVLQLKSAIQFYAELMKCMVGGITAPLSGQSATEARLALAECFAKQACGKVTTAVGHFTPSEVNWTNMLIKNFVSQAFNGVCKQAVADALG